MSVQIPLFPAQEGYEVNPVPEASEEAKNVLEKEITSEENWNQFQEKDDVKYFKRQAPGDTKGDIPMVRGTTLVENATPDEVYAAVANPGFRKYWDGRFEEGYSLKRFAKTSYIFYTVMKGVGFIFSSRDIVGVQNVYRTASDGSPKPNDPDRILMTQKSIVDDDLAPEVKGKVRATVVVSGWHFVRKGNNTEITYLTKILLGGSVPSALMSSLSLEIPGGAARVRDNLYERGYPPYIIEEADQPVVFQRERFEPSSKEYTVWIRPTAAGKFTVRFDAGRMYSSGVTFDTSAGPDITADVQKDHIVVSLAEGAANKNCTITVKPT